MSQKSKGKKFTFVSEPDVETILEARKRKDGISYDFTANSAIRSTYGSGNKSHGKIKTQTGRTGPQD